MYDILAQALLEEFNDIFVPGYHLPLETPETFSWIQTQPPPFAYWIGVSRELFVERKLPR